VNAIIRTLSAELEKFKDNKEILKPGHGYIPELAISTLHKKNKEADNQILIATRLLIKGADLVQSPRAPGFIITTEVFRGYEGVVDINIFTRI